MNEREFINYLQQWDDSVDEEYSKQLIESESRRRFIKQLLLGSAAMMFADSVVANTNQLTNERWEILSEVHMHMLPVSENEPDASSINATAYLKSVLEWPGVGDSDKKFILDGVGWLNGLAEKQFNKSFDQLDTNTKEIVLRTVEKSQAGENWLSLIMLYLIEALLTDPVYGGNVNGQGWQWLEYQSGFPTPSVEKRYFNL